MRIHLVCVLAAITLVALGGRPATAQPNPSPTAPTGVAAPASAPDPTGTPAATTSAGATATDVTNPTPSPAAGPPAASPPAPSAVAIPTSLLPKDLSVGAMFHNADIVVQAVLVGLVVASIVTWTFLFGKGISILMAQRSVSRALADAETKDSLAALQLHMRGFPNGQVQRVMTEATAAEMTLSGGQDPAGIKERIASRLIRIEAAAGRRMARGTGLLATIGSTAPFVGLFGTVWGIMNSFIGISQSQTTNLAVVAPGIAEALLATATGLVAAIPAVVIYNVFARAISGYRASLADLSASILRLVSRELDRRGGSRNTAAAAE
jgi:biopolymer transport protein ExbB